MKMTPKWKGRLADSAAQYLLGLGGLALLTFICFQLDFGVARTGFAYTIVIALVSLLGSFSASIVLSVVAAAFLNYFFSPPLFEFRIDAPDDIVRIMAFLTTSLVVTALITRRKHAERELAATMRKLEEAQRLAHVGWWERDLITGRVTVSDEVCQILGMRPVARWLNLIHPEDRPKAAEAAEAALSPSGPRYDLEYRVVRSDGTERVVHSRADVIWDESGRPLRQFGVLHDITELRRAEQEARASEARYRAFVDHATDAFFMLDDHSIIIDVNRQACSDLGYSREELIGKHRSIFDISLNDSSIQDFKHRARGGEPVTFETRHRRSDGSSFPVEVRIREFEQGGRRFMCAARDITERERARKTLRESEAKLERAQRIAHVGWWERDFETRHVTLSDEVCEIFGVQPLDLPKWHDRWLEIIHPEDRARVADAAAAAVAGGPRYDVEYRVVRPDGVVRTVHSQGEVTWDEARRPVRQFGVLQDITERKESEQRLIVQHAVARILAEALTIDEAAPKLLEAMCETLGWDFGTLWFIDDGADVLFCAHMWCHRSVQGAEFELATRVSRFPLGRGLPGHVWARRTPICIQDSDAPNDTETIFVRGPSAKLSGMRAAFGFPILAGDEIVGVLELASRYIRQDNERLLETKIAVCSQIGQFIERKRASSALQVAQQELAHMSRITAMGELTASIAHEINQPLTGLVASGNACLLYLNNGRDLEAARRTVKDMISDAFRASEVVNRIRALAKKSPPKKDRLSINEVVLETVSLVRNELQRNNVTLELKLAQSLPPILGDRVQLQQVLLNLIINAKEAIGSAAEASSEITVITERSAPDKVQVTVSDTGPGFSQTGLDEIFEAFYTTKPDGMGMGLKISRSIVEAHGGKFWAMPNQPRGAAFQFTLSAVHEEGL